MKTTIELSPRIAARLTLAGRVQGIGMRPAVARFAERLSLAGYVANTRDGVEIHVEGPARDVERFEKELSEHLPSAAGISSFMSVRVRPTEFETFLVKPASNSTEGSSDRDRPSSCSSLSAVVPPDVVVCDKCLAEVRLAQDRRYEYPFTSCTNCGPRYSIVQRMPYERDQTGMAAFPLCDECRVEYESPADRRFHAQTNACPDCGPRVWLHGPDDRVVARERDALKAAASAILDGRIVALRGLGGYQLLTDATSQEAVRRLRRRKQRFGKPLAVMVSSLDEAETLARLSETERRLLRSPSGPILVAAARADSSLASSVSDGMNTIGLLLPTTPLHWLLLDLAKRPLVCTSANVEGDPLVYTAKAATEQLRDVADVWLEHDRPILRPIDDSVFRVMGGRAVSIRSARGYAPLPLDLESDQPLIALGGHQKTSVALSNGAQAVLGPHVGNLDTVAARRRFVDHMNEFTDLYGIENGRLVCDRHPDYFTTEWAEKQNRSVIQVSHHHAHVAAGMLEAGWLDRQVLGVSFDGTGYGLDGTIWGGEFLLAEATGFQRVGYLRPFSLPGGEKAIREPWRVASALVSETAGDEEAARLVFQSADAKSLLPVLRSSKFSPTTTSAGRLFDGVAALVLGVERCEFEGRAAMLLEAACDLSATGEYGIPVKEKQVKQLDWRPLVRQILRERAAGVSPGEMAMRFHRGLATAIVNFCRSYASLPVVLAGGVFQNRVLVELLAERFSESHQPLGLPGLIPPNDGGLAAGQLAIAASVVRQRREQSCA